MKKHIYLIYISGLICGSFHTMLPSQPQRRWWIGQKWDAGKVAAQRAWRTGKGVLSRGKAYISSAVSPYVSLVPFAGTTAAIVYFATDPKFVTAAVKDPGLIAVIAMLASTGFAATVKMESLTKRTSVPQKEVLKELLSVVGTKDTPLQYYGSNQDKNILIAYFIAELTIGIETLQKQSSEYKPSTTNAVESKKIIDFGNEKKLISRFKLSKNQDKISLKVDLIGEGETSVSSYKYDFLPEAADNLKIAKDIVKSISDYGEKLRTED